jgi:hypothetical protein
VRSTAVYAHSRRHSSPGLKDYHSATQRLGLGICLGVGSGGFSQNCCLQTRQNRITPPRLEIGGDKCTRKASFPSKHGWQNGVSSPFRQ